MDGMLLQTAEALGEATFPAGPGGMWELLQAEKEHVEQDILSDGWRHENNGEAQSCEPPEEGAREVAWRRREQLEDRLRAINDAQDRLIDGGYGTCLECGRQIEIKRLCADPAVSLCIACKTQSESESTRNAF